MSSARFLAALLGGEPAAATAVTLSGPSSGVVGVPSSNFTVGANGTITGTVTVTPSDGGDGGTFTPTSVAISSGTPTATFTYTPGNVGAPTATITVTNDGGLTNPAGIAYTATSGSTPISFAGTVPAASFTVGTAGSVDLAPYFSGTLTPFTYALDGASAALPSGVTLSSAGLLSWSGSGTAGTTTGVIVQGTDASSNTADTNAFSIAIAAAPTGNIRLQPALDLQRGGDAASLTGLRWCVYTDGLMTTIAHSGGGLSTNSSGQPTIDINGSGFTVGDWVLVHVADPNTAVAAPADRTVGTFLGWVQAIAQV